METVQPQRTTSNQDPLTQLLDPTSNFVNDPNQSLQAVDSNESKSDTPHRSSAPTAQLSCELCRQRKVKCDKGNPCSTCQRAGVKCYPIKRQRLPRGRNGGRRIADAELKARVGRLENLVRSLEPNADLEALSQPGGENQKQDTAQEQQHHPEHPIGGLGAEVAPPLDTKTAASRYIGSSFWQSISQEVSGIRDVLEEESEDEVETTTTDSSNTAVSSNASNFNFVLCGPNSFMMSPDALRHPSLKARAELCKIYCYQADPLFKILHRPSLVAHFLEGKLYLGYPNGHPAVEALSFSIYHAAVMSQTEEDCKLRLGEDRSALLPRFKFATEVSLARASLLTTTDLTVLQAFLLFLLVNRVCDSSRTTWTLLALAYRIGRAMGLHQEDPYFADKPFERELRRRAWYAINLLDAQGSIDRGSEPMIVIESWTTHLPMNINDEDIWPGQAEEPSERETFTDITFSLLSWNASSLGKRLNFIPPKNQTTTEPEIAKNWKLRSEYVDRFQQRVKLYLKHADKTNPMHMQATKISECMVAAMRLIAVRPINRDPSNGPPKVSGSKLLDLACEVLDKSAVLRTDDPAAAPFRWLEGLFVHWHALAVALAELCHYTEGRQVDRAWIFVEAAYERYSKYIADSSQGMLWRPITKLLKRARSCRQVALSQRNNGMMKDLSLDKAMQDAQQAQPFSPLGQAPLSPPKSLSPSSSIDQSVGAGQGGPFAAELGMGNDGTWSNGMSMSSAMADQNVNMQDSPGVGWENWEDFVSDLRFDDSDVLYSNMDSTALAADVPGTAYGPPLWNISSLEPTTEGWNMAYSLPWK